MTCELDVGTEFDGLGSEPAGDGLGEELVGCGREWGGEVGEDGLGFAKGHSSNEKMSWIYQYMKKRNERTDARKSGLERIIWMRIFLAQRPRNLLIQLL